MSTILFIGEAPGPQGPRDMDAVFARRAVGCDPENHEFVAKLLSRSRHRNLLDYWPGADGQGSYFPVALAREKAGNLRLPPRVHTVVLLGRRVAAAFDAKDSPYFDRFTVANRLYYVVPHPSGVNHWWNDPDNRWRARRFLEEL